MPDVIGSADSAVAGLLQAAGISDFEIEERPSLEPSGQVVDQHPSAGQQALGTIIVTVAVPLPPMPDYTGQRIGDVRAELESWGVTVVEEPVLSTERPEDEVLETTPQSGDALGSEARLLVVVQPVTTVLGGNEELEVGSDGVGIRANSGLAEINGELYETALFTEMSCCADTGDHAYWDFNLGRDWESFEATVGLLDDSAVEQRGRFRILVEGSVIWEEDVEFGEDVEVSINISDGLRLRLEAVSLEDGPIGLGWGNARLLGLPGVAPDDD